jgi:preprotein translocase subunit SecA
LHQAVEAKEGVRVKEENQTLATITLQNFFKLYKKISGMTGTAMTEAGEFWKIYQLEVIAVPTNRGLQRLEHPDVIYRSEPEKFSAIADEIERMNRHDTLALSDKRIVIGNIKKELDDAYEFEHANTNKMESIPKSNVKEIERAGRPILVGTVSIEKSERLSAALERRGIKHEVLNAKHHSREAEIVSQAGRRGRVTIATNMAGRGTDIVLGGNPETMAWALLQDKYPTRLEVPDEEWNALVDEIEQREQMKAEGKALKELGGLHIIGTERHEARRIDLQLRGRCGRQGDPGSSRFYLSLEDDLMRIFAGEWVKNMLTRLGMQEGEAIESRMVSRRIEGAQKKVEERHFEARKSLLEYDEVMDEQRKRVYGYRQQILDGQNCRDLIGEMISDEIDRTLAIYLATDYGTSSFASDAGRRLGVEFDPRDYRGVDFDTAQQLAKDEATRMAETQVLDAIDENLPEGEDPDDWAWEALAKLLAVRWNMNYRDRDLKKIGRDELGEVLIVEARAAIDKIDLEECRKYLEPGYGIHTACDWLKQKFDLELDREAMAQLEPAAIVKLAHEKAGEAYDRREAEFPIMVGLNRFSQRDAAGARYDREQFVAWAADRFHADLSLDDLKNKQRDEVKATLYELSRKNSIQGNQTLDEAMHKVDDLFAGKDPADTAKDIERGDQLQGLVDWLHENVEGTLSVADLEPLTRQQIEQKVTMTVEEYYRPEMRRLERALVLQLLDTAWKEHLLTMDHLRSSVGLRGYAQVDPKVEYKREGMRMFEDMWKSLGDAVTNLIFRMEQLDENFVGSTWKESAAVHESPPSVGYELPDDEGAGPGRSKGSDEKLEPIRNMDERVGRNQLCPCGSGKKYKQCCMKKKDSSVRV